jgi:hypothetical protein
MTTGTSLSSANLTLDRRLFTLALLLSTWVPMVFFITVGSLGTLGGRLDTAKATLLFVGGAHVAATLMLYVDKRFLSLVRESKARYIYVPLALILASGFVFTFGGRVIQVGSYAILWGWQTYHYGRQNIGVYSFAGIAQGWLRDGLERRPLQLTTLCAVCATFKVLGRDLPPTALRPVFDTLYEAGYVAFMGMLIFSIGVFVKNRRNFSLGKAVFFFTCVLFFLPMFVSQDIDIAFFSYAIAHGCQYFAFVGVLSFNLGITDGRRGVSARMMAVAALLLSLGIVGYWGADLKGIEWIGSNPIPATVIDFLAGIGLGTTLAHFVIDAGAWRLSQPSARNYMTHRFGFLFRGTPARSRALVPEVPVTSPVG